MIFPCLQIAVVNRTEDGFAFKNDHDEYRLRVGADGKGQLEVRPYDTE